MQNQIRLFFRCGLLLIISCWLPGVANAQQTFTVDRTDDDGTFNACMIAANNDCTLRGAIVAANATPGTTDTINFSRALFLAGNTIILNTELTISSNIIIEQEPDATAPVTISGGTSVNGMITSNSRIFTVNSGFTLTLTRLKLNYGNGSGGNGGAIYNNGTLTINQSTISENTASLGGGIYNNGGTVVLDRSTVSANISGNGGGGIYNFNGASGATGSVSLTNSTISGNSGGIGFGGGYFGFSSDGATSLTTASATIASNSAGNGGGIAVSSISGASSTATLSNTIVADNSANALGDNNDGPDIFYNQSLIIPPPLNMGTIIPGTIFSSNYNLIEVTTGGGIVLQANDRTGDPKLDPLADNNFVFAPSHALRNTVADKSPAIDAGSTGLASDQRGSARDIDIFGAPNPPDSDNINDDIGAFEAQLPPSAAFAMISGRFAAKSGKGIRGVQVTLTNSDGTTRVVTTNFFGYYRFVDVPTGQNLIIQGKTKFYQFTPQVVTIIEDLELNFTY